MKKICLILILICLFVSAKGISTTTPKTTILGTYETWTAYMFKDSEGKVCYMAAMPKESEGKYTYRDDVFLTITHRPKDKSYDVVSLAAGFTYKKGSKPTLRIDNEKALPLYPVADMAWLENGQTDSKAVQSMIKSSNAIARGESVRGTKIVDTFSLKGFTKAYDAINKACGR